ncbi:MAG: phytanoyl-CoA dioxygenase family protein [Pseudomonadota bacterium]|nr:phytanoyl-CoA dioxygenase family protein [Pseudomonadota bacterium]
MNADAISDEEVSTWRENGVVCLRQMFSHSWMMLLEKGFEEALVAPGELSKDYAEPGMGSFFTDHAMFQRVDAIRRFVFEGPAAAMAARLMGAAKVNLIDDHLLVKEPGTANPTYWHQDQPYFQFAGEQFCSIWIAIDTADEGNGTLRFVPGSHRWGKEFQPVRIGIGDSPETVEGFDGPAPDVDGKPDIYETCSWNLASGDCIAFHGRMLHGAYPNASRNSRRRAISLRFAGDDIRWQPRAYAPTETGPSGLKPGDVIDSDEFPAIWRA